AFAWNMTTWWFGLPSSSSHALIGGLCGAALAAARGDWSVIKWNAGVWPKVVVPMITSPLAGFIFGGLLMFLLFLALHRFTPHFVQSLFGKLQIFSAAWMAHSHGTNDAQKTMGIITLALFTGTKAGRFDHLPAWLDFLKTPVFVLPKWVIVLCALISGNLQIKDRSVVRCRISRTFFSPVAFSLACLIWILRDTPPKTARRDNRVLPRPRTRALSLPCRR